MLFEPLPQIFRSFKPCVNDVVGADNNPLNFLFFQELVIKLHLKLHLFKCHGAAVAVVEKVAPGIMFFTGCHGDNTVEVFFRPGKLCAVPGTLLPESVLILTYELALRFMTDYLNGDLYFKTLSPDHNLVRTRAQIRLTEDIEARLPELREITKKYAK